MRKKRLIFTFLTVAWISATVSWGLYFRLDGDRLWLQAEHTPLSEVLEQFGQMGVEVKLDPSIQTSISASIYGQHVDEALESILKNSDYQLTWKLLRGPLGRVPKLKEIQVFHPGKPAAAKQIPHKLPNFVVSRGVSGNAPEHVKDELLVTVRPGTSYAQFQRLLDQIGGMLVDGDAVTGVYLLRFPGGTNVEALLAQILRNSLIANAELNYIARLPEGIPTPTRLPVIPPVVPPADGAVPVAVLDSGLDPKIGFGPLLAGNWDAVSPERPLTGSAGHGTQMALLASGLLAPDGMLSADQVPVVSVRAFDEEGKTSNFAIFQALAYAAKSGAKVVNMSWGSPTDSEFMRSAIQVAARQGLVLVAAAGNEPTGKPVYPAAYPDVLAVGAILADGQAWPKSNHGDFVDVSAYGTATFPIGHNGPAGAYVGTSISSAAVAHALAQYFNLHPKATPNAALAQLKKSLSPAPPGGYGAGVLDAAALARFLAT
jgi:hypothetical protein